MEFLTVLWIPILLTAVVLFVASFVAWSMLPHHEADFKKLEKEDELMDAVRNLNPATGSYMFPFLTHAEQRDPAMQERYMKGPRGKIVLWDVPNMGKNLVLTFLYFLIIAFVTAYISWAALGGGVGFMKAFQITGAIGVLVFATSGLLNAVWFPRRIVTDVIDGIVYGIIMGLFFGFFWPAA